MAPLPLPVPWMMSSPTLMTISQTWTSNGTWTGPRGLYGLPQVYVTGPGGNGAAGSSGSHSGAGGGSAAFGGEPALGGVGPGTVLTITAPTGGSATAATVTGGAVTVQGNPGGNTSTSSPGTAGAAGSNTIAFAGAAGGAGLSGTNKGGGSGAGSAGSTGAGGPGGSGTLGGTAGGTAGTGAAGPPSLAGATGGTGGASNGPGGNGGSPGAGGGGGGSTGIQGNGTGGGSQVIIIWQVLLPGSMVIGQSRPGPRRPGMRGAAGTAPVYVPGPPVGPPPPSYGPVKQSRPGARRPRMRGAPGVFTATPPGPPVPPPPPAKGPVRQIRPARRKPGLQGAPGIWAPSQVSVVNQWAATFAQPSAFGPMPPALQSVVVALNPSTSVGGGTGFSTAGNWLFCITGMNEQSAAAGVTVGAADDQHSFWRPGDVTASNWAVSTPAALTRTSIWYTPNIIRQVNDVYVAPSGALDGCSVLVIEVSGLSPWDVVTGIFTGYVAASMGLTLGLPAPPQAAFLLAAACGDSTSAGQQLAPAGWDALQTVTASNGTDHTCDAVLTAACFTTTTSVSVQATATSATDMSGVIIGVLYAAPSPIPGGANPAWPQRFICEAAFGSGYETPPDQMTWTTLTDSEWPSPWGGTPFQFKRAWGWTDRSGIPWGLGQYQSSAGTITLDNFDGWLSPSNVGSGFYFSPAPANANPSFQSGTAPWTATGSAALAQSAAQVFSSAAQGLPQYSLMVTPDGIHSGPGAASEKDPIALTSLYSASAWFYSAAGWATGAQVSISWYTSGGALISVASSAAVPVPAATWTQVTLLGQTPPGGAAYATISAQLAGTPGAVPFWVAEAWLGTGSSAPQTGCVTAGTPVRLRMALGTITTNEGSTVYNRWYCWQRNAQSWPEKRNKALRGYVQATTTDPWQSAPASCPTPYRAEVEQDQPGWWWPADDQPLSGGVLPTSLRNAATGSSTVLNIVPSPNGVSVQDAYSSGLGFGAGGTDVSTFVTAANPAQPSIGTYAVGASAGWMYGDPQVSPASAQTGNPVTAQPGSAAWEASGQLGNTGSYGWCLVANDTFPSLANGVTVAGWFKVPYLGTAGSAGTSGGGFYNVSGQPYAAITLLELATNTGPVAVLQLTSGASGGHLQLITYNGSTPTTVTVYSASDLRCGAFFRVCLQLTRTSYKVLVNAGLTANVSGSCTISASAWQWLIANGDLGSNGGSAAATGLVHGGNMAVSHLKVFTGLLPLYRELAQYAAAIDGCGRLPAPSSVQATPTINAQASGFTPDGTEFNGGYGGSGGGYGFSAVAVSVAGAYTSGPAARAVIGGKGNTPAGSPYGAAVYASWSALAPLVQLYTAATAGGETEAAACLGAGDTFTGGYGASATGAGVTQVSSGTGAAPPSGPSALGDQVGQRLERILGYAKMTTPMRAIDPAPDLVQAAIDVGGQQAGASCSAIVASDSGLFFYDLCNVAVYKDRPHLNSDSVIWQIGMNVAAGQIPFAGDVTWDQDPQRAFTAITVQPYSPDGATLADLVPSNSAAVSAAQAQYGARPLPVVSYLQDTEAQQDQADFLFSFYGTIRKRASVITIDAAKHPAAWGLVASANVGDLISVYDQPFGAPATTVTFRISQMNRNMSFGANGQQPTATIQIVADPVPPAPGYWT